MAGNNLYQTGELADACGTTVRTVQYYDSKGLLAPSGYSEGGRRLYSSEDAERLRFILMLKALGLKLAQIKGVLESPNRDAALKLLLDEQAESLARQIDENTKQLHVLNAARTDLEHFGKLMATTEPAMVKRMNDEKARTRWWITMVIIGVFMDAAWIGTLVLGIVTGIWWPFPVALVFVALAGAWQVRHYSGKCGITAAIPRTCARSAEQNSVRRRARTSYRSTPRAPASSRAPAVTKRTGA